MSPFTAWLLLAGVKTLSLRVDRHASSAQRVAETLAAHPAVETVSFPGLTEAFGHDVAKRLTGGRYGGLLSFTLKGGQPAIRAFVNALELATIAVSLGECIHSFGPMTMDSSGWPSVSKIRTTWWRILSEGWRLLGPSSVSSSLPSDSHHPLPFLRSLSLFISLDNVSQVQNLGLIETAPLRG